MTANDQADQKTGRIALNKASWRILPLLFLGYGIAYVDRVNIGFAALQMNQDLHFSATVYGLGGGLFFLSYAFFEVPSNLLLLRFGARRWIARIMVTWGILAAGMMFVRTPMQFYAIRFLLGMAEAGFFPGVVCFLMQWFPAEYRGRAISRFYIAYPLSAAVMGAIAGPLLGLDGHFELAGWQWLFLVEGIPAVLLGGVILVCLPNSPAQATWLTEQERDWIQSRLSAEKALLGTSDHRFVRALFDPAVVRLGICNMFIVGASYAFGLSAPAVLTSATHWSVTKVGLFMSATALLGALSMIFNGAHSDHYRERYLHAVIPLTLVACALFAMGFSTAPWVVLLAYALYYNCYAAVQTAFWLIPSDTLHGRSATVGVAAIGSIGMLGAFIGPYSWGLAKDYTGSYQGGLLALAVSYIVAGSILMFVRHIARFRVAAAKATVAIT
jgi:ACS family tartrate transporter-like MFS transporter